MFIKNNDNNITDIEDEMLLKPHLMVMDGYIENYIVPEVVAFYLATGYYNSCVYEESLLTHINTVIAGFFNHDITNINKVMDDVKRLLLVKYGLKVITNDPLKLEKIRY